MMTAVGSVHLDEREAARLRGYLLRGGFLWVDDFWGSYAWSVWASQIRTMTVRDWSRVMRRELYGSIEPAMKRIGADPATSSAPFVATLVDVTGLVIYFSVAALILRGTLL